jgi:hypothetical protein
MVPAGVTCVRVYCLTAVPTTDTVLDQFCTCTSNCSGHTWYGVRIVAKDGTLTARFVFQQARKLRGSRDLKVHQNFLLKQPISCHHYMHGVLGLVFFKLPPADVVIGTFRLCVAQFWLCLRMFSLTSMFRLCRRRTSNQRRHAGSQKHSQADARYDSPRISYLSRALCSEGCALLDIFAKEKRAHLVLYVHHWPFCSGPSLYGRFLAQSRAVRPHVRPYSCVLESVFENTWFRHGMGIKPCLPGRI